MRVQSQAVPEQHRNVVHLLKLDTLAPVCGATGADATPASNEFTICLHCVRRITEEVGRSRGRATERARWSRVDH